MYGLDGIQDCNNIMMEDFYSQIFENIDINGEVERESLHENSFRNTKKDVLHEYEVTLEDLYRGKNVKMAGTRNIICPTCKGSGKRAYSYSKRCVFCDGKGVAVILKQIKPGMIIQQEIGCQKCNGAGSTIQEKDKCRKCKGIKTIKQKNIYVININKGMKDGERIIFHGEADEEPGTETGDLVFIIKQKKHDRFKRLGCNLKSNLNITLSEALCGFSRVVIETLDGRGLHMTHSPGKVLYPGQILVIQREGMPKYSKNDETGDLYLEVVVEFPPDGFLHETQLKNLSSLLPSNPIENNNFEIVNNVEYEIGSIDDIETIELQYNQSEVNDVDEKRSYSSQCNNQ